MVERKGEMEMDQKKTGQLIADLRKEIGLTQEGLGEKLGVSQRSVSRWETGKNMPDLSLLTPLADTLGVSVTELLAGERIEGETVPKSEASGAMAALIALARDRRRFWNGVKALISGVLTLVSMIGLYNAEFCVSIRSAADLERAIAEYRRLGLEGASVDVLEWESVGKRLIVLYKTKDRSCGLASLQQGAFGRYRMLSAGENDVVLCAIEPMELGRKHYLAVYAPDALPDVASINVIDEDTGAVLYEGGAWGGAFLELVELDRKPAVWPFGSVHFYDAAGEEIPYAALLDKLGLSRGNGGGGTGTAELGLLYVFEGVILVLGIIFIRYFLKKDG